MKHSCVSQANLVELYKVADVCKIIIKITDMMAVIIVYGVFLLKGLYIFLSNIECSLKKSKIGKNNTNCIYQLRNASIMDFRHFLKLLLVLTNTS